MGARREDRNLARVVEGVVMGGIDYSCRQRGFGMGSKI